ncbi:alpha/beta hydrolase-fold protein [Microbacterium phyllosphaerae]|uniref:alpha/beta hydrolase-fold protein n=1 Tax=Microbacterium phyllosphaerae TaxID=124798 RepID=UPI003D65B667
MRTRTSASPGSGHRRWMALLAVTAVGVGTLLAAQPAAAADAPADPWISQPADGLYRFTVPDSVVRSEVGTSPAAVAVEGNFGPGNTSAQLNLGLSGGSWTATIGPLEPGQYYFQYKATIGGTEQLVTFRNPATEQVVTAQPSYSTFFVDGESAAWQADVPAGGQLQSLTYQSTAAGAERSAQVWTPPSYDANRADEYPVLYLLQDTGQAHTEWTELGRAAQILDNLAVEGQIEPMVVVMADGNTNDLRTEILDDLLPAVGEEFHVSDDAADRAIAGIGRGASQALTLMVTDPGEFSKVGSFSGSLVSSISSAKATQINAGTDLVRLYVGNTTDRSYNQNVDLAAKLDAAGVEYEFDGVNPAYGDIWETWQESLRDFSSRLFHDVDDHGMSEGHRALEGTHSLPAPGTTPTPWVDEHGVVTFETGTEFSSAKNVTIWANWAPGGNWLRIPMEKAGDRWRLTLGPIEGGSYYYKFVVDRVDRKDAGNPTNVESEPNWSTFFVAGDGIRGAFTGDVAPEQRGAVQTMPYSSLAGGADRSAYVWTPPGYDPEREEPYPVFFLQHGGGQTWSDWIKVGRAAQILDNHYANGTIRPMVVVMANGNGVDYPKEITQKLIPTTEAAYNVSSDPSQRALAGLSMGSGHALSTLYAYPGEFAYIGAFSAFTTPPANADVEAINAGTKLLSIYTGDIQDFTYQNTMSLISALESRGITHDFHPPIPGPHSWDVWQKALIDFLPKLFVAETASGVPVHAAIAEGENGALAMTVADFGEGVQLSAPQNVGDRLRFTGELPEISVTDSRTAQQAGLGGWSVAAQAQPFVSAGKTIEADHLGWVPKVLTPRAGLEAGDPLETAIDGGLGLATSGELASADSEGRFGSATLSAGLRLEVPVDTQPGSYSSVLSISLFPVD